MKTKQAFWLLLPLIALAALLLWRIRLYSGAQFLSGDSIFLIDQFRSEYIVKSIFADSLKTERMTPLKNRWQKLTVFSSAAVWRTFADSEIFSEPGADTPRLFNDRAILTRDGNIFRPGVQPARWDFYENQIFLTISPNQDPNRNRYFLEGSTYARADSNRISGENLELGRSMVFAKNGRKTKIVVYSLKYPLFVQGINPVSPKIVIQKGGKILPASEWYWMTDYELPIYEEKYSGPLNLYNPGITFEKELYIRAAPFSLNVMGRGEMAGPELPRLAVLIDNKKIGTIEVKEKHNKTYQLDIFIREGRHRIKIFFENDYFRQETHEDRNVLIKKIWIHYKSAVAVIEPPGPSHSQYIAEYSTFGSEPSKYYRDLLNSSKISSGLSGIKGNIALAEDLRRSLVLAPGDKIEFPILVPQKSSLKFGYALYASPDPCPARVSVKVHQSFRLPRTVFSASPGKNGMWNETSIDLNRFSNQKIRLSFETEPAETKQSCHFLTFLSNPEIQSDQQASEPFKHIILISFDALRMDHLGIYGYPRRTSPNIDAFARDSIIFDNALTAATWTLPSFNSLFTSLYPAFHKADEANRILDPSFLTLSKILKNHDYRTAAFVDNVFLYPVYGFAAGFDSYNYQLAEIDSRAESSLEWLNSYGLQKEFLFIHLISPHTPYRPPVSAIRLLTNDPSRKVDPSLELKFRKASTDCEKLSPAEMADIQLLYDGEILQLDGVFQRFMTKLKQLGVYDDALIVLMSDHGEEFMEHGNLSHGSSVFQETVKVPLMIKLPQKLRKTGESRFNNRVMLMDIMPTILELLKVERPAIGQGLSLVPLIFHGDSRAIDERDVFVQSGNHIKAILSGRYKYIYSESIPPPQSCRKMQPEELYDLQLDPGEEEDLSRKRPDLLKIFEEKRQRFEAEAANFQKKRNEPTRTINLDPAMKDQLRALGYVQ